MKSNPKIKYASGRVEFTKWITGCNCSYAGGRNLIAARHSTRVTTNIYLVKGFLFFCKKNEMAGQIFVYVTPTSAPG